MVPVKKLIALFVIAVVICTSVVGCGETTTKKTTPAVTTAPPTTK
jgi:hypothetical protein